MIGGDACAFVFAEGEGGGIDVIFKIRDGRGNQDGWLRHEHNEKSE